jgi:hypothetical protein
MKTLTITKAGQITHGPSQFPTESELIAHLARHEGMGTYGAEGSYEVLIEDITEKVAQEKINAEALAYLAATDWLIIRQLEAGVVCPQEIIAQRAAARASIIK